MYAEFSFKYVRHASTWKWLQHPGNNSIFIIIVWSCCFCNRGLWILYGNERQWMHKINLGSSLWLFSILRAQMEGPSNFVLEARLTKHKMLTFRCSRYHMNRYKTTACYETQRHLFTYIHTSQSESVYPEKKYGDIPLFLLPPNLWSYLCTYMCNITYILIIGSNLRTYISYNN